MLRKYHLYIVALFFFFVLQVGDFINQGNFHERSQRQLELCLERRESDKVSSDDCFSAENAASGAYSAATSNHGATYLVIVMLAILLIGRITELEDRLAKVEGSKNA